MTEDKTYSKYAILCELNSREFKRKLDLFPAEMRFFVILANSIIGAANAKKVQETPEAVVKDGEDFLSKLLGISPEPDDSFREILATCLIETIKDELRYCCSNCAHFDKCLDLDNLSVGMLFRRRAMGEETEELRNQTARGVAEALQRTPYVDSDSAHTLCKDFRHQYSASRIGEVFARYSEIAGELRNAFGIDYKRIQQEMIAINMAFSGRAKE